jgi:hypothetical protein
MLQLSVPSKEDITSLGSTFAASCANSTQGCSLRATTTKEGKMKKLFYVLATAVFIGTTVVPTHAEVAPSIAVIDTGTTPSLFGDKIVAEYCVVESYTCANGKTSMEGVGASALPAFKDKALDHGTQMLSIIAKVNPSAKLLPIRIVGVNPNGNAGLYTLDSVKLALDWVIANQAKYNIAVVNISQGRVFADCRVPAGMVEQIATLKARNVAVISATGNDGNKTAINSPACIGDVVAVGATDNPWAGSEPYAWDSAAKPYIARYTNISPALDFYANGRWFVTNASGITKFTAGTSNATASMSGLWLLKRQASVDATYAVIVASSTVVSTDSITGKYVLVP